MKVVQVPLRENSYSIEICPGLLASLGESIARINPSSVAIVTDENVGKLYGKSVCDQVSQAGIGCKLLEVPTGETSKSIAQANWLWEQFSLSGMDRKSVVIALGGGVVGDLAGFAAATYLRGVRFVQLPTTLLAQVDSSVGGKVGINLPKGKNLVGAFFQPALVMIDIDVLQTLSDREFRAGMAEVVKYGVILDADFFADLESKVEKINLRDSGCLSLIVARCCELKASVVAQDEKELTSLRAILNYGHTFGHAIEAVAGYGEILHGEAVAMGMTCAAHFAMRLGRIDESFVRRQTNLLSSFHLPTSLPQLNSEALLDAMMADKKFEHRRMRFVLPQALGSVELVDSTDRNLVISTFLSLMK